jgi:two-component system, LuxR family, sensor kinase FixL
VNEHTGFTALLRMMVRTIDGIVTAWSPAMERRYGFSQQDALGRTSAELLRSRFPRLQPEIEADFADRGHWTGGVINYRADGRAVATVVRWDTLPDVDGEGSLVVETHSDIDPGSADTICLFGDLVDIVVRELSEALTAVCAYNLGARLALEQSAPDGEVLRQATAGGADQIRRSVDAVHLLRGIMNVMREID